MSNVTYQDVPNGNQPNDTNPANGQPTAPTSEPHNISKPNFDITNPFANPKIRNNEEDSAKASQPESTSKPAVTFEDIVNKKQFGAISKELFDKVSEGDVDSFNSGLQGMMRQVYKTAIEDSNRLMDARFAKFQDELMGKLNTSKEADNMLNELKSAIPYAKDPAVEPVARQILSGYLRQGMSKSEAIGATNAYFNRLADTVGQKDKPESKTSGIKYGRESWDELFNN